jgi:hypothetical protein
MQAAERWLRDDTIALRAAAGRSVRFQCRIRRDPTSITTNTYGSFNLAVTVTKKSQASTERACNQRQLMPQINALDLFASPPRRVVPVHYVFGGNDALNPPALVNLVPAPIAAPRRRHRRPGRGPLRAVRSSAHRAFDCGECMKIVTVQTGSVRVEPA